MADEIEERAAAFERYKSSVMYTVTIRILEKCFFKSVENHTAESILHSVFNAGWDSKELGGVYKMERKR